MQVKDIDVPEGKQIIDGKPDSFYSGGCGVEGELGNETAGSRLF